MTLGGGDGFLSKPKILEIRKNIKILVEQKAITFKYQSVRQIEKFS